MKLEEEIQQKKFKSEYQKAAINIVFTHNWLSAFYENCFKPHDITVQQFNILRILRGQHPKPASIKLLKERMLDRMSDVSRLVEKLRVKGLLKRELSEQDRRNVDVVITSKGLEMLKSLDKIDILSQKYLSNLNEKEIRQLNYLLDKIRG